MEKETQTVVKYAVKHIEYPWYIINSDNGDIELRSVEDYDEPLKKIKLCDTIGEAMRLAVKGQRKYGDTKVLKVYPLEVEV